MKRIIFYLIFLGTFISCFSQEIKKDDLWKGIDKFILGTDKSAFVSGFKNPPSFDSSIAPEKQIYSYQYWFPDDYKCIIEEIDFNIATLSFNSSQKLISIYLSTIYKETDSTDYFRDAENDIKKLAAYLSKKLKTKGALSYRYQAKNKNSYSYEWRKKTCKILSNVDFAKTSMFNCIILSISLWDEKINNYN